MTSYLFLAIAYGILMEEAGIHWYYSMLASTIVYTGAFLYVLITFISGHASLFTTLVTALSYKWKHSTFIGIVVGTACYMVLLQLI